MGGQPPSTPPNREFLPLHQFGVGGQNFGRKAPKILALKAPFYKKLAFFRWEIKFWNNFSINIDVISKKPLRRQNYAPSRFFPITLRFLDPLSTRYNGVVKPLSTRYNGILTNFPILTEFWTLFMHQMWYFWVQLKKSPAKPFLDNFLRQRCLKTQ